MGSRSGCTPNVFRAQATGDEAKIWHHLFKALARVGQDFCLDVDDRKVSMRTINSGQSAYATASFPKTFFREYSISGTVEPCKIVLKPMCAVFKFSSNVEEFSIALDCDKSELSVVLTCKDGIIKRFRIEYETSERQMAVYDKSQCQNSAVLTKARPLLECLQNFQSNVAEATMEVTSTTINWRSFSLGCPDFGGDRELQTTTSFNPRQLHNYQFDGEPSVTFSIKELKEWVACCDKLFVGVSMHFSDPGQPMIFSAERSDEDQNFELELVLATIDTGDKPPKAPKEASTGGHASNQTSQDLSCRASDHGYDDSHGSVQDRGSLRLPAESEMRTVRRREASEEKRRGAGGRCDAGPRQATGRKISGAEQGRGRESMEHFTNDSIMSAATSDQQESYCSLRGGGSLSSLGAFGGEGRAGGGNERREVDTADHSKRRRNIGNGEGKMEAGLPLTASQEDESEIESSAMATISSMTSGPAPSRKADADRVRPSAEEWVSSGSVCGEGGYREKEGESSGRASANMDRDGRKPASSSQRLVQNAGTKRISPEDSDDPYSDMDDDEDIVKATPSPPE